MKDLTVFGSLIVSFVAIAIASPIINPSDANSLRVKREDPGFPFYFRFYPAVRSISYLSEIPRGVPFLLIAYNPGCGRCERAIPQFAGAAALLSKRGFQAGALSIYYSHPEYSKIIEGMGYVKYPTIVLFNRAGRMIRYYGKDPVYASMWDYYHFALTNQ